MNELDKVKMMIACLEANIVPLGHGNGGLMPDFDVNRALDQLPPDEARKMKRKFRKLWRQAARRFARVGSRKEEKKAAIELGWGNSTPEKKHKNRRKWRVFFDIQTKSRLK